MRLSKALSISVILGLVITFVIGFIIGLDDIVNVVRNAKYEYLAVAFLFNLVSMVFITARWKTILSEEKIKVKWRKLFLINLAGMAVSNITPSARFGGEPLRAYFLNKEGKTTTKISLATIVADRLFDGVVFLVMSFIIILIASASLELPLWIITLLIFAFILSLAMVLLIGFVSINKKAAEKLTRWIFRKFSWILKRFRSLESLEKNMINDSELYAATAKKLMKKQKLWMNCIILTLFVWVSDMLRTYFIFKALGIEVPFAVILAMIAIAALVGSIPLSPGGLGLMESAMIIIYSSSGITLAIAGMSTILDRLISFWIFTFIGLAAAYYLGIKHYKKGDKK